MQKHYRLSLYPQTRIYGKYPEEEYHTNAYRIVKDMPWSKQYINKRLEDYLSISDKVETILRTNRTKQARYLFSFSEIPGTSCC